MARAGAAAERDRRGARLKVYLAGPMSSIPDFNFPAFYAAAAALRREGHEVFCPAEEDLKEWGTLEQVRKNANYRTCLRKDLLWILDHAEAIAFLPGWEQSRGAVIEEKLAAVLTLPVLSISAH